MMKRVCEICLQTPCCSTCPNYDGKTIAKCQICYDNICDDENYAVIDGDYYHMDCLEDSCTLSEVVKLCGGDVFPMD